MYLFYKIIRFLEIYALFLQTDSDWKSEEVAPLAQR